MTLQDPIDSLKGVGPATTELLAKLNIHAIGDALHHIPFRYDDFRTQKSISEVVDGDEITLAATLKSITKIALKRNFTLIKATIEDATGTLDVTWFNQPYLLMTLRKTKQYLFSGKIKLYKGRLALTAPTIEQVTDHAAIHSGRLVPIYPATDGVTTRSLRTLLWNSLHSNLFIPETLPIKIVSAYNLSNINAFLHIHFPEHEGQIQTARHRLAFEEVYQLLKRQQKENTHFN
jgi:ATP-dependent DNA helicase RecG